MNSIRPHTGSALPALFDAAPDAIVITDSQGLIQDVTAQAERLFDYARQELYGRPLGLLITETPGRRRRKPVAPARKGASGHTPVRILTGRRRNGAEFPVEVTSGTWESRRAVCEIDIIRDASDHFRTQRELETRNACLQHDNAVLAERALRDPLTGLMNRLAFAEQLDREVSAARRYGRTLSLILLDVDRFKSYNDRLGHLAGDEALRTIAGLLQRTVRLCDHVARYGGEEFVVLLPSAALNEAVAAAERLRLAVANHAWPQKRVTVSLGVACLRPASDDAHSLVEAADRALYRAKESGRNNVQTAAGSDLPQGDLMPA